jgi:hypothetical protein
MSFRVLFIILSLYPYQILSRELTVYRWVDKDNIVHFSQHQPVGDKYTQFFVSDQSKVISRADTVISEDVKPPSQKSQKSVAPMINIIEQYKQAKDNISMLMAFDKVQYIDDKNTKKVLTKEEKQQQLAINKKRTELYCTSANDK